MHRRRLAPTRQRARTLLPLARRRTAGVLQPGCFRPWRRPFRPCPAPSAPSTHDVGTTPQTHCSASTVPARLQAGPSNTSGLVAFVPVQSSSSPGASER
eukprot:11178321-Lingulodinium_polyedra.AAC.1